VDYAQLRSIVAIKLTMDNRRQRFRLGGNDSSKEISNGFIWQIVILLFFSSLTSLLIFFVPSVALVYTLIAAYTMVMVTMILITDFSQVLLDNSDGVIILPRPVSNKTYYFAKLVHILSYMLQVVFALILPLLVVTFFKYGALASFVFLFSSFLLVILAVFITNLLYLLLIRFSSQEALQNTINYVQIAVTIIVMVGYQLVFRVFGNDLLQSVDAVEPSFYHLLLPPFWLGYAMTAAVTFQFSALIAVASALLILLPIGTIVAINSGLLKGFADKLGSIDSVSKPENVAKKQRAVNISELLSNWFLKTPAEKSAFGLVWKLTSRDRKFKLRTYPSLAYLLVYIPIIFGGKNNKNGLVGILEEFQDSPGIMLSFIYFTVVIINVIQTNVVYHDEPKAAWVYGSTPIKKPGELLSGQFWAIFFKFQFTAIFIVSFLIIYIWGVTSIDDILFGLFVMMAFQLLINIGLKSKLPFSFKFEPGKNANFIQVIGYMIGIAIMGGVHWTFMKIPFLIAGMVLPAAILVWYLSKELRKVNWSKIDY
jgi:hypothetical protein